MNTIETTNRDQQLRKEELDKREQKLSAYALKLKEEKQALDEEKIAYQSKLNASFNDKISKAIEEQQKVLDQKYNEILEKQQEYASRELEHKEKEAKLELERNKIENEKKELHNHYQKQLEEKQRKELLEFGRKLEEEFNKQFEEKIALLKNREENLTMQEHDLKLKENDLNAERRAFEVDKDRQLKRQEAQVQATVDSLERRLKIEEVERNKLLEEYKILKEEYGEFERFKDRDLVSEKAVLENERKRLEKELEQVKLDAESREESIRQQAYKEKEFYQKEIDKIEQYDNLKKEFDQLTEDYRALNYKLKEQGYYERLYQIANDRIEFLQSQFAGKEEQNKREEAIKQEYVLKLKLNNENKIAEKDEIRWLENIENNMKKYGLKYPRRLLYAFHTALKTASMSPLSVLSGVSGTGKSELPKLYAHFGGFNFLSEAVQPTWDSPASMVGFYNTIEGKFDSTNLFKFLVQTSVKSKSNDENAPNEYGLKESMNLILLDELNLAHIELYFAEFLSKFEVKRGSDNVNLDIPIGAGLTMPIELDSNLLWVGTMNEDETTKSLSDKVLDRAFCLNFPRPKTLVSRLELKKLNDISEFKWLPKTTWEGWVNSKKKDIDLGKYQKITEQINEKLSKAHRAIGHRVWQSMEAYILNYPYANTDMEKSIKVAFEDAVVQKIMPKLRGIELHGKEGEALGEIKEIIVKEIPNLEKDFVYAMSNPYGQFKFNSAYYLDLQKNIEQ